MIPAGCGHDFFTKNIGTITKPVICLVSFINMLLVLFSSTSHVRNPQKSSNKYEAIKPPQNLQPNKFLAPKSLGHFPLAILLSNFRPQKILQQKNPKKQSLRSFTGWAPWYQWVDQTKELRTVGFNRRLNLDFKFQMKGITNERYHKCYVEVLASNFHRCWILTSICGICQKNFHKTCLESWPNKLHLATIATHGNCKTVEKDISCCFRCFPEAIWLSYPSRIASSKRRQ